MLERYSKYKKEYDEINEKLKDKAVFSDAKEMARLTQKQAELKKILALFEELKKTQDEIEDSENIIKNESDPEMIYMAEEEVRKLKEKKKELNKKIELALLPKDQNDSKNVIMEIRAGAGGEEASLFASDLFKMYSRFAEKKKWHINILNSARSESGGFKEIIFEVKGHNVYKDLKYESGVHRVQRVPKTESQGRIHTSTVTVAVLPEAEEVDIKIDPKDIRIDVFRSSGPGGQSVNTTDSAVRITHLPSGLVVSCQEERSQLRNRNKAMSILRSRLFELKQEEERKKRGEARKMQIGTGERSEKIRTYNFPQNRVTDHRIGFSLNNLSEILNGEIGPLIKKLEQADLEKKLEISKI